MNNHRKDGAPPRRLDAVVVGAGFGGMYMVHKLRQMGLDMVGIEAGGDVGGVWYWNRYPGARCDLMCIDYSYGFSSEIEQEWTWPEQFAHQRDILAYANFVADKLDLRRDFKFNTRVTGAVWDDTRNLWTITTDGGEILEATHLVMASGPLSVPREDEFKGLKAFRGELYRTGRWPQHEISYAGKRVGVIGVGSTGVQIVPVVAEEAAELYVFQRTPSFSMPMRNSIITPEYAAEIKRNYPGMRAAARNSLVGGVRPSITRPFFSLPPDQRKELMEDSWKRGGHAFLGTFSDLMTNPEANEQVAEFVRGKISEVVTDPVTAEKLKPRGYPIFARRPCLDTNYYESFNLPHVHLVDCNDEPIECLTEKAVKTSAREIELDIVILATGYDGLTGSMLAFDITGRNGASLRDKWRDGPISYLGLSMAGFPNLFMICGANGPSALANIITLNEQNGDWICDVISHMGRSGLTTVEATETAEADWMETVRSLAKLTLMSKASTWYTGTNVEGKARGLTMYTGGYRPYRETCEAMVRDGYRGLAFTGAAPTPSKWLAGWRQRSSIPDATR